MDLNKLKDKAANFSDRKFGHRRNAAKLIYKLKEEVDELHEHLNTGKDPSFEFADCFLIIIDAYRMYYGDDVDMQKLINDCSKKLDICEERVWGNPDKHGNFKHIK
jgi:NTP pyrophosphatase (non-canonical NTP hydrolase)